MRLALLATALLVHLLHAGPASEQLAKYSQSLRDKFPNIPVITTAELAALNPPPLLLDARSEREFAVSHLATARRFTGEISAAPDHPIVVYCSVGYRSALVVRKLNAAGFTNVRNLEGSIFAWANESRPLVDADGPTKDVHPFNFLWARYLERPAPPP